MKKTVAVIFGGRSAEHDVSIITAHIPIIESLLATNAYDVWPIYIAKDGSWYADQAMNDLSYFKSGGLDQKLSKLKKVQFIFDNGLKITWPKFAAKTISIDVVFPAMHGTYGEDGSLMGLLRMAGVPFTGCDLFASAVAMDKVLTKQVAEAEGVKVVPYVWFTKHDFKTERERILKDISTLSYPLFVKPVHLGSSIGIGKVKSESELINAIEVAFHYDDKVLVEEGIQNLIEVTLPVMGNDELTLANIERPLNNTEFFAFEDKYLKGGKKGGGLNNRYSEIPAQISAELSSKVESFAKKTYKALGCSGIVRIDFLIDEKKGEVYMNEVNTLPGSLYHHNWKKKGVSGVDLVTKLISLGEERFASQKELTHTFNSDILSKIGAPKTGG